MEARPALAWQDLATRAPRKAAAATDWACSCALCKALAIPLYRRLSGGRRRGGPELENSADLEAEIAPTARTAPAASTNPQGSPQATAPPANSEGQGGGSIDVDVLASKLAEELERRVVTRVEAVEKEIEKVKEGVNVVAQDLTNAVMEVRAALSELGNPFNYMRKYAEIVDEGQKLLQLLLQQAITSASSGGGPHGQPPPPALGADLFSLISALLTPQVGQRSSPLVRVLRLVKWVDEHLLGMPREVVEDIIAFAMAAGLIGEKEKNLLTSALKFVEGMRRRGLGLKEQMLTLYTIAKMLGIEDREADAEIARMLIGGSRANT